MMTPSLTRSAASASRWRSATLATATRPDAEFERQEATAMVRAALTMLGDRDREALLLKAEGFSYDEIATTLGLAKGAVGTTLARARRRLRPECFGGALV